MPLSKLSSIYNIIYKLCTILKSHCNTIQNWAKILTQISSISMGQDLSQVIIMQVSCTYFMNIIQSQEPNNTLILTFLFHQQCITNALSTVTKNLENEIKFAHNILQNTMTKRTSNNTFSMDICIFYGFCNTRHPIYNS